MNKVIRRTKSDNRFQNMRSVYLGDSKKQHKITGFVGQRSTAYVSWGFNLVVMEKIKDTLLSYLNNGGQLTNLLFINDFTFEAVNYLIDLAAERSLEIKNITVAFVVENDQDKASIQEFITDYFSGIGQLKIVYIMKKPVITSGGFYNNGKVKKDIIINDWNLEELENMNANTDENLSYDLIMANTPYGIIGASITKVIRTKLDYNEYVNLAPGNDYFINGNFEYLDKTVAPLVLKNGAFSDANQTITIAKINKTKTDITATEARLLLSVRNDTPAVYQALKELWLNTESNGYLKFTQSKRDLAFSPDLFVFNPGAFDIHHGYFAVANKDKWTASTEYNIYNKSAIGHINLPKAKVQGCTQFKKLVYSELGLRMFKLWFTSSPEGWGFANGMFADIDYSDCKTWNDVFEKLNISKDSQAILITAANEFTLNAKEQEICKIVAAV